MGCGKCGKLFGLLILIAGVALLLFGLGNLEGHVAHQVAGGAFVLLGLGKLACGMGMCGSKK